MEWTALISPRTLSGGGQHFVAGGTPHAVRDSNEMMEFPPDQMDPRKRFQASPATLMNLSHGNPTPKNFRRNYNVCHYDTKLKATWIGFPHMAQVTLDDMTPGGSDEGNEVAGTGKLVD